LKAEIIFLQQNETGSWFYEANAMGDEVVLEGTPRLNADRTASIQGYFM